MDHDARGRASLAIFDLINTENVRARKIAAALDARDIRVALDLAKQDAPLSALNDLLRTANLPIEILIEKNGETLSD